MYIHTGQERIDIFLFGVIFILYCRSGDIYLKNVCVILFILDVPKSHGSPTTKNIMKLIVEIVRHQNLIIFTLLEQSKLNKYVA